MSKIYTGDVGTAFMVDCGTDITDAITHIIKVTFPDGSKKDWEADIQDAQYLKYILVEGDTDQIGYHTAQAYIETSNGKWYGETFKFCVYALGG